MLLAACGRTELVRYSTMKPDASVDAGVDAGIDAGVRDAGVDAGIDAGCNERPLSLQAAVPTVMFVIDRSGSMDEDLDGNPDAGPGRSRWNVLETSLRAVLPPLDNQIAMGELIYPVVGDSCAVPTSVDLSPRTGNATSLISLITTSDPLGGTPTSEALRAAANHLLTVRTASSARAMVLATDGAPNCNFGLDQDTCTCTSTPMFFPNCDGPTLCLDDARTVSTLTELFVVSKVPTYVIGLGSSLNQFASTLDRMAIAGGVPRMGNGARYYSATNQAELTDAFARVTSQITRCTYLVSGYVPGDIITFRVNGVDVPQGMNGWDWTDEMKGELVVHGATCDQITRGGLAEALVECN